MREDGGGDGDDDDDDDDNDNDNNNNNNNNNSGSWYHLKIKQKIPEKPTGKARNQGTTEDSHTGHFTHTAQSTDVKAQNIRAWEITLHVP